MTRDELLGQTKKALGELARAKGLAGWHRMSKEELAAALSPRPRKSKSKPAKSKAAPVKSRPLTRTQTAAARNTNGSAEELIESSKYNVGVPTKDLSAKVPKDLPQGYGKDRIVAMSAIRSGSTLIGN